MSHVARVNDVVTYKHTRYIHPQLARRTSTQGVHIDYIYTSKYNHKPRRIQKLCINSFWSLSYDDGLRCSDELMSEQQQQQQQQQQPLQP